MLRILAIGMGVVINALLARMLSPNDMGAYFLAISVIAILGALAQMGLPQAVVRLVAESMSMGFVLRAKQVIWRSLFLSLLGGVIIASLFYFWFGDLLATRLLHSTGLQLVIGLMALSILVNSVQGVVGSVYRGFHDIRGASIIASVLPQLNVVGLLALWWLNRESSDLQQVFAITLASSFVGLYISSVLIQKRVSGLHGIGTARYSELLTIAWPLCLIQISIFVATQADLWVVGAFFVEEDVAVYGAVQKLVMLITMTYSLMATVAQSSVAELYAKGEKLRLERMTQGMAFVACMPSGLLLLLFIIYGEDVLRLVFGGFYQSGYLLLLILGIGQFVSMVIGPADMLLAMTGFQKQLMRLIVVSSLFRILLAVVLAKQIGLMGVALGWSIGAIAQSFLTRRMCIAYVGVKSNAGVSALMSLYPFRK